MQAMMAAIRDYQKDMVPGDTIDTAHAVVDVNEHLEDAELQSLYADRIAHMKQEHEKRAELKNKGHGTYTEIQEGEFLEVVTQGEFTVVHFCHREFERCKIMDKHLGILASKYFKTRFVKLSAPDAPFFVLKLHIKTLPCVVAFVNGVTVGRVTGFDGLGGDDFATPVLEAYLDALGVLEGAVKEEQEDFSDVGKGNIRKSDRFAKTQSDEDSDFD